MDQVIPGDDLFLGIGAQAVGAREVNQPDLAALIFKNRLFLLHGDSGPVAHLEPSAGQGIDQGGFPGIGIAGHRHGYHLFGT